MDLSFLKTLLPVAFINRLTEEQLNRLLHFASIAWEEYLLVSKRHNLEDWDFGLITSTRKLGTCRYRTKTVALSAHCMAFGRMDKAETIDTVRHELAHALVGPGKGHGPAWKKAARLLGAKPTATSSTGAILSKKEQLLEGGAKWGVILPCGEVVETYQRRVNKDWSKVWLRGRKQETKGKLSLISAEEYKLRFA